MELEEFYTMEPFGEYRNELRHGQQMALTSNLNRNTEVKTEPFIPLDFMNFEEIKKVEAPIEPPEVLSARISSELFKL